MWYIINISYIFINITFKYLNNFFVISYKIYDIFKTINFLLLYAVSKNIKFKKDIFIVAMFSFIHINGGVNYGEINLYLL